MRVVLQRVSSASVSISDKLYATIEKGLLILVGVTDTDTIEDAAWLAGKVASLRIFPDEDGKMNLNISEAGGSILVVSQFTLYAETKKGNRPSFIKAARPEIAVPLYEGFLQALKQSFNGKIGTGQFGADMQVRLVNDGPVTIVMDSQNRE